MYSCAAYLFMCDLDLIRRVLKSSYTAFMSCLMFASLCQCRCMLDMLLQAIVLCHGRVKLVLSIYLCDLHFVCVAVQFSLWISNTIKIFLV